MVVEGLSPVYLLNLCITKVAVGIVKTDPKVIIVRDYFEFV